MNLHITTRHCELDPETRTFAENRVRKMKRYFDQIIDVNVILTVEKHRHEAEVTLHTNGSNFVGAAEAQDLRSALELAAGKIEAQLKKLKDKRARERRSRTSLGEAMAAEVEQTAVEIDEDMES